MEQSSLEVLKKKFEEIKVFKFSLNDENLKEFETLKAEISELLNDNQRIRLVQINFTSTAYFIEPDYDLPF